MDSPGLDETHTRAICDEIGERLRTLLKSSIPDDATELDDELRRFSDDEMEPEPETEPNPAAPH